MTIEVDGPPAAYFEDDEGNRHVYEVHALKHTNAAELIYGYAKWRAEQVGVIVWRWRPDITYNDDRVSLGEDGILSVNPNPVPYWKIAWRSVTIPVIPKEVNVPIKPEGEPVEAYD